MVQKASVIHRRGFLPPLSPLFRVPSRPTLSASEDTPSSSSPGASNAQLTPNSDGPGDESFLLPQPPRGVELHKLQTDFNHAEAQRSSYDQRQDDSIDYAQSFDSREGFKEFRGQTGFLANYSAAEEREVVRKFDRHLVSFLALLYLLSFLDRSNIGNAKIAGLADDLDLSSSQYEWLLTAFYITYILFEWMTLMYRIVPPHVYISLCVLSWGLIASFQSLVTSFGSLVVLRALLGISEAAFGPGVPFYLSLFYKREEQAFRTGLFISAAPLATSFASSLAWLIVKLSDNGLIAPWRTLFLVEGFPSVVVAVIAWKVIPDSPGTALFLTRRERKVAKLRLQLPQAEPHQSQSGKFDWRQVGNVLADPKSYLMALMFLSCNVAFSSMPVFLPTIIKDMGFSRSASQALSAPPYIIAFFVVLVTAYFSDRDRARSPYLIVHALLSSLSYLIIAATGYFHSHLAPEVHTAIRYFCIYPATFGFFSSITIIITWSMDNRVAKEGKGAGVAILNIIGQCGPLIGTRLYPESDGPWYVPGMVACSLFMASVVIMALVLRLLLQRDNRKMAEKADSMEMGSQREEREGLMGSVAEAGLPATDTKFTYII
ncbi:hypothetical protein DTO027B5_1656 [Paecilomyces variotii]|nr:hypothetical protein DTO032I3_7804 [Paecilomyces variotii]KAJ9235095.1 hypothetical protein DTO169E5_6311 [Paecilomyces variotii]KAJ9250677.1 hypothetical protein DTO207G8_5862 [Paecilomyces variotii]KAJ9276286.1 hypothetical protein DTO021D3_6917 [Paecilomyces variotii]KAJ9323955.1 hypothetical protein DTO027B3_5036 [Paecilomyces variotii]